MKDQVKISVTYVISNINKALAFEWISEYLDKKKFRLSFVLLNPESSHLEEHLRQEGVAVHRVVYKGKKDIPLAILKTARILRKEHSVIVHAHLFDAGLVGLNAAKLAGVKKRIYTRHHSSYHHTYHPHAVKYDILINRMATHIIAVSEGVKKILVGQERTNPAKVTVIHHGFKLEDFSEVNNDAVALLREKYNPSGNSPVIGVISRYTQWKGIQYIIPAFKKLLASRPDALLILCNAHGDYEREIKNLLHEIPAKNYKEIRFENNIFAIYRLFDIFVHVPVDEVVEAFGQTYVEALAAGIPAVFSQSGIGPEFIEHKKNAFVVPYRDAGAIDEGIRFLLDHKNEARAMAERGKQDVQKKFSIAAMIGKLEFLYES